MSRKYARQAPRDQQTPCVGRCYLMKRDGLKADQHLEKMIDNWKLKRSCVGICHLIRVKLINDKKFRTNFKAAPPPQSITDPGIYYEDYEDRKSLGTTMETTLLEETSTGQPSVTADTSIYSQLLWNSFLKKIDSSKY